MMTYPCGRNFLEQEVKQHTTNTQLKHYQHTTSTGTLIQELTKKQK